MSLQQPIRYPVSYYSWQDKNAPELVDADGCIKTILKACLVTGFGDKAGAGWTALFEDDSRIVLRRPLRTGNPPDIKIENGVVGGQPSHRIVGQANPTGLDDANELSAVNLLARDRNCGKEWHLIATDFAFILCYQMLSGASKSHPKNYAIYVGAMSNIYKTDVENFYVSYDDTILQTGMSQNYNNARMLFAQTAYLQEIRTDRSIASVRVGLIRDFETKELFDGEYFVQSIILDNKVVPPYFYSVGRYDNSMGMETKQVMVSGRPMLRYINKLWVTVQHIAYIPLDYWEL